MIAKFRRRDQGGRASRDQVASCLAIGSAAPGRFTVGGGHAATLFWRRDDGVLPALLSAWLRRRADAVVKKHPPWRHDLDIAVTTRALPPPWWRGRHRDRRHRRRRDAEVTATGVIGVVEAPASPKCL